MVDTELDPAGPTAISSSAGVRRPFRRHFRFDLRTGIILPSVTAVMRIGLVLGASASGNYQLVSVFFAVLIALPWIALNKSGRRRIGLTRPTSLRTVLLSVGMGSVACLAIYTLMTLVFGQSIVVFGQSIANPFAYIASSYSAIPRPITESDRLIYFLVFAVINGTFGPIGEGILYRGMSTEMLRGRLNSRTTARVEAGVFALVHLSHFGVVFVAGAWILLPFPAVLWFGAMFLTALIFAYSRRITGSLIGAMLSHGVFNITMTALIFFALGIF